MEVMMEIESEGKRLKDKVKEGMWRREEGKARRKG